MSVCVSLTCECFKDTAARFNVYVCVYVVGQPANWKAFPAQVSVNMTATIIEMINDKLTFIQHLLVFKRSKYFEFSARKVPTI